MKKTTSYVLFLLVLLGGMAIFFKEGFSSRKEVSLGEVLIEAEDVSGTDFYVDYQEMYGADYYDLPISQEISKKTTIHLAGTYKEDTDRTMFLTSEVTKFAGNAVPDLEGAKKTIADNLGNSQSREEFMPEFEASSSYNYRKCVKVPSQEGKKAYYMCVIAKVIRKNYLFTLVLHGSGVMTNDELENILEIALNGKKEILERLP